MFPDQKRNTFLQPPWLRRRSSRSSASPFVSKDLGTGYMVVAESKKEAESKYGGKQDKKTEGKCGEGKCGGKK